MLSMVYKDEHTHGYYVRPDPLGLQQLLAMKPGFAASAREEFGKWHGPGELIEHVLDGLRKAGLEISAETGSAAAAPDLARSSAAASGIARAEEGFWVAVLPFK